jgi:hypothetical protein
MPKNITNGEFVVDYNQEDKVDENFKLVRAPTNDSLEALRGDSLKIPNNFYIESIQTIMQIFEPDSLHKSQKAT